MTAFDKIIERHFTGFRLYPGLGLTSRIHPISSPTPKEVQLFIKRDDELSHGGTKVRKYASFIPWLIDHEYKTIGLIGGWQSNHLAGILPLLIENGFRVKLFLRQTGNEKLGIIGNSLITRIFSDNITAIPRESWNRVEQIATQWAERNSSTKTFIVPEGGACYPSVPGAATLALDIPISDFDHIFIDCGTGVSLVGFLLGARIVPGSSQLKRLPQIHALNIGSQTPLKQTIASWISALPVEFEKAVREDFAHVKVHTPVTAKSFGVINRAVSAKIIEVSRREGVLLDPVYTAKTYITLEQLLQQKGLKGKVLVIHSGGTSSIHGVATKFSV